VKSGGGAIFIASNAKSDKEQVTITGSTFTSNSSQGSGGDVYIGSANTLTNSLGIKFESSTFTSTTSDKKGGSIFLSSGIAISNSGGHMMRSCTFTSITSKVGGVFDFGFDSGVAKVEKITVKDCKMPKVFGVLSVNY
jgi:hypothetical protein